MGDEWGLQHFSKNESEFRKCFRRNAEWKTFRWTHATALKNSTISNFTKEFSGNTLSEKRIESQIETNVANFINSNQMPASVSNVTHVKIQTIQAIKSILLNCSDDEEPESAYIRPPHFIQEPEFLGLLIDMILTNLPDLRELLSTQMGLVTFQRFCEQGLDLVDEAHAFYGNDSYLFRVEFGYSMRAMLFFNGRDVRPFINYTYTLDHPVPYVRGNISTFIGRNDVEIELRNPDLPQGYVDSLLNIYPENPSADQRQPDPIFERLRGGINSITNHFQYQLALFPRFQLAYLELLQRRRVRYGNRHFEENTLVTDFPEDVMRILTRTVITF